MDPAVVAAWASWIGAAVTAIAGYFTFRQARTAKAALDEMRRAREVASDQASSARDSALSASKSADAAMWQAKSTESQTKIALAQYRAADKPEFRSEVEIGADWLQVRGRMTDGPHNVTVDLEWFGRMFSPDIDGTEIETWHHGVVKSAGRIFRNGEVVFGFGLPAHATRGEVEVAFFCTETYGDRYWPVADTIRWAKPGPAVMGSD